MTAQKIKFPPACYAIGDKVMVRRLPSSSRKRAGKTSAGKRDRIVEGTVIGISKKKNYKVRFLLHGEEQQGWFAVSDLTSTDRAVERKKQSAARDHRIEGNYVIRNIIIKASYCTIINTGSQSPGEVHGHTKQPIPQHLVSGKHSTKQSQ